MAAFSWFRSAASNNRKQSENNKEPFFKKGGDTAMESANTTKHTAQPFFTPSTIQPKLTIGQPNDKYEQEADAMADKVAGQMNHSAAAPVVQTKCADCEKEQQEGKVDLREDSAASLQRKPIFESNEKGQEQGAPNVQRKCSSCGSAMEEDVQMKSQGGAPAVPNNLSTQLNSQKGKGNSLPESTRSNMESSFGTSFENVNIHTDNQSAEMNQSIGAQAFTHGSDIYFNRGKYQPGTGEGQHLLAHELTHVVQQRPNEIRRAPNGEDSDIGILKGAAKVGLIDISKFLPEGASFPPAMSKRHLLSKMHFWKGATSNSYLIKPFSAANLSYAYIEAARKGIKDGFISLSNGQKWYVRLSDGKFFPASGPGIIQLTQQEVSLMRMFTSQLKAGTSGHAQILNNLLRAMQGQGYTITAEMEVALSQVVKNFGVSEKTLVKTLSSLIKEVEHPPAELIKKAKAKSAGRGFKILKWGGRFMLVVAVAIDVMEVYEANFAPKLIVKKAGAWGGTLAAGGVAATKASPLLAGGPWGWVGYGLIVGGAGIAGYFVGGEITETIYEWTIE